MVFCEAVAYALSCIRWEDLKLKPKQVEALDHLYNSRDVFAVKFLCTQFQFYVEFYDLKFGMVGACALLPL